MTHKNFTAVLNFSVQKKDQLLSNRVRANEEKFI